MNEFERALRNIFATFEAGLRQTAAVVEMNARTADDNMRIAAELKKQEREILRMLSVGEKRNQVMRKYLLDKFHRAEAETEKANAMAERYRMECCRVRAQKEEYKRRYFIEKDERTALELQLKEIKVDVDNTNTLANLSEELDQASDCAFCPECMEPNMVLSENDICSCLYCGKRIQLIFDVTKLDT